MKTITAKAKKWKRLLKTTTTLRDEIILVVNTEEGNITSTLIDPAHIAMIKVKLKDIHKISGTDDNKPKIWKVGLQAEQMLETIKELEPTTMVTLRVTEVDTFVEYDYNGTQIKVGIDYININTLPERKEITLKHDIEIVDTDIETLHHILKLANNGSGKITFEYKKEEGLKIATMNTEDTTITVDCQTNFKVNKINKPILPIKSTYMAEKIMDDLIATILPYKDQTVMTINLRGDYPLQIDVEDKVDDIYFTYMLAPRME